jgi:hypothetical protein
MANVHVLKKSKSTILLSDDPLYNVRKLFKQDHRFWKLSYNRQRNAFTHFGTGRDHDGCEGRVEIDVSVEEIRAWLWHFLDGAKKISDSGNEIRFAPRLHDVDEHLDIVLSICRTRNLKWGVDE